MRRTTPATLTLDRSGVTYELVAYAYDPDAAKTGLQAAEAMGAAPETVLKTLMARAGGQPVCVVVACDREVSMKKLAAAVGAKSAEMMPPADAERMTGYHVGGISPFGQRRQVRTVLDAAAADLATVYVNGGQRGLEIRLAPADLARVLDATVATVT
jgi:Cys-tRNA(Pro)/Cys-tRNA(Cys) deacylase